MNIDQLDALLKALLDLPPHMRVILLRALEIHLANSR